MIVAPAALALLLAQSPAWAEPPPSETVVPPTPAPAELPPPPPGPLPPPPEVVAGPDPSARPTRYLEFSFAGTVPVGRASARVTQDELYSVLIELELQAGRRLGEHAVAGGYAGFGVGGVGTRAQRLCSAAQKDDCTAMMGRAGLLGRASLERTGGSEPWALLGLGGRVESADVPDRWGTVHARLAEGVEARLGVGVDFPASRPAPPGEALGIGLYLEATLFQALGSDAIPELGVPGGRRPLAGWIGAGLRFVQR